MRVMVGVCGSVAAYKAVELVRLMQQAGHQVEVAMTRSATGFVTPLTFAALTGRTVHTSLWLPEGDGQSRVSDFSIDHIAQGQNLDALVIAPATARTIAKMAVGLADDFLGALYLATRARVFVAPAMNVNMWQHAATQRNVDLLKSWGVTFIEPGSGYLACGMTGSGRLAEPELIVSSVLSALNERADLADETVLITGGGTREPIDPVRFIGNRSSGKMGHALAEEAVARGARVILVSASSLPSPAGCTVVRVETTAQMSRAVLEHLPQSTIVIKAAAVADFRLRDPHPAKLRRADPLRLELEPTEDIVAQAVAARKPGTLVVAFAAETEDLETNARAKLVRKGVDAIVANSVATPGLGFDSERNAGMFITRDNLVPIPECTKREMASEILDQARLLRVRRPALMPA
jgi:phosphopantothenoylcysteine decarboxylase/phosphopantothenate--cysteine ligase